MLSRYFQALLNSVTETVIGDSSVKISARRRRISGGMFNCGVGSLEDSGPGEGEFSAEDAIVSVK